MPSVILSDDGCLSWNRLYSRSQLSCRCWRSQDGSPFQASFTVKKHGLPVPLFHLSWKGRRSGQVHCSLRPHWSQLYGTLPHSATRPLKTYSMAVRAIPLSVCHQRPPSGYRTGFKKCSDAQQFIQLTVVDDINAKSGWSLKTEKTYYDMHALILLTHCGIYFWHELAYTFPHF
jgi:hypothetical protein